MSAIAPALVVELCPSEPTHAARPVPRVLLALSLGMLWCRFAVTGVVGNFVAAEAALAALGGLSVLGLLAIRAPEGARGAWSIIGLASLTVLAAHPHFGPRLLAFADQVLGSGPLARVALVLMPCAALACLLIARRGQRPAQVLALLAGGGALYLALRQARGAMPLSGVYEIGRSMTWLVGCGAAVFAHAVVGLCCGLLGASETRARPLGRVGLVALLLALCAELISCWAALGGDPDRRLVVIGIELIGFLGLLCWGTVCIDRLGARGLSGPAADAQAATGPAT